jgi:hypothetical protein
MSILIAVRKIQKKKYKKKKRSGLEISKETRRLQVNDEIDQQTTA